MAWRLQIQFVDRDIVYTVEAGSSSDFTKLDHDAIKEAVEEIIESQLRHIMRIQDAERELQEMCTCRRLLCEGELCFW